MRSIPFELIKLIFEMQLLFLHFLSGLIHSLFGLLIERLNLICFLLQSSLKLCLNLVNLLPILGFLLEHLLLLGFDLISESLCGLYKFADVLGLSLDDLVRCLQLFLKLINLFQVIILLVAMEICLLLKSTLQCSNLISLVVNLPIFLVTLGLELFELGLHDFFKLVELCLKQVLLAFKRLYFMLLALRMII